MKKVLEINEKTVGIIGGMGPQATVDLMQRIIRLTPAKDDADHVRCIVDNNPKIPSRIKAIIEGGGENPAPCMADMAKRLELWGADFLAIACNTAHYYFDTIADSVNIPVLNIVDLMVETLLKDHTDNFTDNSKIGLLASPAIGMTKLYESRFDNVGLGVIYPDPEFQEDLFMVIRRVKAGEKGDHIKRLYHNVCKHLLSKGAGMAIIACTELSALNAEIPMKTIDAAEILAQRIVDIAKAGKEIIV